MLACDLYPNKEFANKDAEYVTRKDLLQHLDIISLHRCLTPQTHHLIDDKAIALMKTGVMLVNLVEEERSSQKL